MDYWGYLNGFSAARLSSGSVVAWGANNLGQCDVPSLPPGLAYVQIDAGPAHALGLRSDGSVVTWGDGWPVPALPPPGLTYIDVVAGGSLLETRVLHAARRAAGLQRPH